MLVVHPEGNIMFNSGLLSLVSILSEEGFGVDYFCPRFRGASVDAALQCPANVYSSSRLFGYIYRFQALIKAVSRIGLLGAVLRIVFPWKLVIGIDKDGIILGDAIAAIIRAKTVMISYEITFESETGQHFKKAEIAACRNIQLAICQGGERSMQLSLENHIPIDKILDIPVAGRGGEINYLPSHELKHRFNISHPYVAVVAGSLDDWTLIDDLVRATHCWPHEWALLIHSRYEMDHSRVKQLSREGSDNVYFSNIPLASHLEASSLFCQADLGIALYKPTYRTAWLGKNLAFLGLSSGKTAMYLQGALPVVTTRIGEYPSLLEEYNAGFVVDDVSQIAPILRAYPPRALSMRQNARKLFEEKIDANLSRDKILNSFAALLM
jgi:glycosyltransferase involved in cell wall biosynthesis